MGGDGRSDRYARQQVDALVFLVVVVGVGLLLLIAFLIGLFIS